MPVAVLQKLDAHTKNGHFLSTVQVQRTEYKIQ
jgi:hypothetical protein